MARTVRRRLVAGVVFVGISLINLAANASWLRTGDIHCPNFHVIMQRG